MNRLLTLAAVLLPAVLVAQVPVPPLPPVPPAPSAPPATPVPPVPPVPPRPVLNVDLDPIFVEQARAVAEQARALSEQARMDAEIAKDDALMRLEPELARLKDFAFEMNVPMDVQVPVKIAGDTGRTIGTGNYASGLALLQQRQFERAIASFDRSIAQKESRADGAQYWKAFAQYRLLRRDDALATLAALRRDHPESRYLADAKVLDADARRVTGGAFDAEAVAADEDIRIAALRGLQRAPNEKTVGVIDGLLAASHSLLVKRQAMVVLGQSRDPQAEQALLRYARGGGNPDLQAEAIRVLAQRADRPASSSQLAELYAGARDEETKKAIISALAGRSDGEALVALARTETSLPLKTDIVRRLSAMAPQSKAAADFLMGVLNR